MSSFRTEPPRVRALQSVPASKQPDSKGIGSWKNQRQTKESGDARAAAEKIGCTAETLRLWVSQAAQDAGRRPDLTAEEREGLRALARENRALRRATEILWQASALFAPAALASRPT